MRHNTRSGLISNLLILHIDNKTLSRSSFVRNQREKWQLQHLEDSSNSEVHVNHRWTRRYPTQSRVRLK